MKQAHNFHSYCENNSSVVLHVSIDAYPAKLAE